MLNLKNNENDDDVFDEIWKKKAKIKIKFQKKSPTANALYGSLFYNI